MAHGEHDPTLLFVPSHSSPAEQGVQAAAPGSETNPGLQASHFALPSEDANSPAPHVAHDSFSVPDRPASALKRPSGQLEQKIAPTVPDSVNRPASPVSPNSI